MTNLLCPNCGTKVTHANQHDGRAVAWRVRVRLFGPNNLKELAADSDPDLPVESLGATVLQGLPAVAEHVAALAMGFHGVPCAGLDLGTLQHKIKGLRPTLSRRGGNATWRLNYSTPDGEWIARADLAREETGDGNGRRSNTDTGT